MEKASAGLPNESWAAGLIIDTNSTVTRHTSGHWSSALQIPDSTHYKTAGPTGAGNMSLGAFVAVLGGSSSSVIGQQMVKPQCDNRCQNLELQENRYIL